VQQHCGHMVQRVQVVAGNTPQKADSTPEAETLGPNREATFSVGTAQENQLTWNPVLTHRQVICTQYHIEVFVRFVVGNYEDER